MSSRISHRRGAVQRKSFLHEFLSSRFGKVVGAIFCVSVFLITLLLDSTEPTIYGVGRGDSTQGSALRMNDNANAASTTMKKEATHNCLNDDFRPQNKVGVWTMLNDNMDYVKGAAKLGIAVREKTKTPLDLVVMELKSKPLGDDMWELLKPAGFIRCSVESIKAPEKTRADLKEKFAVLHVWAMEVYETVVFLDADTYAQNAIDGLIQMDLKGKALGVTKDIRAKKWVETFNSGVMLLHPSEKEHKRLTKLLYSGLEFDYIMSDQGFLNEVYKDNWHEIGFVWNANLALYRFQREFWDQHKLEDINIIHYTMQKPWKCKPKGPYGPICNVWINA